jgi:tetratricopeptide (TPR) repeat protein
VPLLAQRHATELNPSYAAAYWGLGFALNFAGQPLAGIAAIERAIRLSPRDPALAIFFQSLALAHLHAGQYKKAVAVAKQSLAVNPEQPWVHRLLAASYGHLGRVREGRAALWAAAQLRPDFYVQNVKGFYPAPIVQRILHGCRRVGWKE